MRIRTIKPTFFLHADLFDGEKETGLPLRVAYAGIWCACDREGRFKWEPRRLGVSILPYDGLDFSRVLDALTTRGFLVKYRVGDAWFGAVPSWKRHQFINNRELPSIIPHPSEGQGVDATATREPRVSHACQGEGKGREGKGKDLSQAMGGLEKPSPAGSNHQAFISGWTQAFKEVRGFDYSFDGGKDAKAVKDLLALGISVPELLSIAGAAWNRDMTDKFCKASKRANAIHSFRHAFNEIRAEVVASLPTPEDNWPEDTRTPEEYEAAQRKAKLEAMT